MRDKLLKMLRNKEIDIEALIKKCSEWTVDEIDSYHFVPIPEKNTDVLAYEDIPVKDREFLDPMYYRDHPGISDYYDRLYQSQYENFGIFCWLEECLDNVESEERRKLISKKMSECTLEQLPPTMRRNKDGVEKSREE
jgi:hypothetical protein